MPMEETPKARLEPFAGALIVRTGAVLSRLIVTAVDALLPAASMAVPETFKPVTSFVIVCGAGHTAMPEFASLQVNVTVGFVLFHPASLGAGEMVAVITGGVLSILTGNDAVATFPATSTAVPEIVCLAPSPLTVDADAQVAIPESESPQLNETVTSVLFQPAALGCGEATGWMLGGVLSKLIVTDVLVALPALSFAAAVM